MSTPFGMVPNPFSKPEEEPKPEPAVKDGASQPDSAGYGENNINLPDDLQGALKSLVTKFETDDFPARLEDIKRIQKARLFWRGMQHIAWNERMGEWKQIADHVGVDSGKPNDETAPYQFVENIYRANGLTFLATMGSNLPKVNFFPQNPNQPEDHATAEAAQPISDFVFRNNKIEESDDKAWFLWTDGTVFSYTRYVTDAERFGTTEVPIMDQQPVQVGEPMAVCQNCGASVPASSPEAVPPACPQCGLPMGPESFQPPQTAMQPVQVGTQAVPNGEEVIDFYGRLEVKIPSYARSLLEAPYLDLSSEVHRGKLRAIYPHVAEKLATSGGQNENDGRERIIRLMLSAAKRQQLIAGPGYEDLMTYKRVWLRPWAFELADEDKRAKLKAIFPHGAYVVFAGETYCESRDESIESVWRQCHAFPGDGQIRDGVGFDLVSVQEQHNTLVNIEADIHEHNIPTTFFDTVVWDANALQSTPPAPGCYVGGQGRPGVPLQNSIFTTDMGTVSPQLGRRREELMGSVGQFLTGNFPAIFGGAGEGGAGDTASGYAMQRDQAMGRIGMLWRRYRRFIADTMELAVECFQKNRKGEVQVMVLGQKSQFETQMLKLDKLQGKFFAYPESNEDFPTTWTQKKNLLMSIVQTANPQLLSLIFSSPQAAETLKMLGFTDFEIPGQVAKDHQTREIAEMLQMGQPIQPGQLDDHATHAAVGRQWLEGDEAQQTQETNPAAYAAIFQHVLMHEQASQMQMQAQAAAQAPPQEGQGVQ